MNITKWLLAGMMLLLSSLSLGAEKDWTLLVFLNGHNSLDSFGQVNIDQMKKVGSTKNINVIVQWASEQYGKTRRVYVEKNNAVVLSEMAPVDMGDYRNLISFIQWGVQNYPAKHYFVDVWNHGNGWKKGLSKPKPVQLEDISYDDLSGHSISVPELAQSMKEAKAIIGHNVDIYGSDACLMQMIEVDYEMAGSVDYVVGSEETEPGAGWPYDAILSKWGNTPANVAKTVATTYAATYSSDVTMSVVDMSQIQGVVGALKDLKTVAKPAFVKDSATKSISFTFPDYVDVGDFVKNLAASDPTMAPFSDNVTQAMSKFVILSQQNGSKEFATGLSIWLQPTEDTDNMSRYVLMQFPIATGWGDLIKSMWK